MLEVLYRAGFISEKVPFVISGRFYIELIGAAKDSINQFKFKYRCVLRVKKQRNGYLAKTNNQFNEFVKRSGFR